jgi:hypothetical protein
MMLNNSNSNNKRWGKRDNFSITPPGNEKTQKKSVDNSWKTWGEIPIIHKQRVSGRKTCGKHQLFHKEIHNVFTGQNNIIPIFSTLYPQYREAYEI